MHSEGITFRWLNGWKTTPNDWSFFYSCYQATIAEHGAIPYLNEAFFGVVATNDYSILDSTVRTSTGFDQQTGLHESTWDTNAYITLEDFDGEEPYPGE